jgi:hypothetical protein
MDIVIRQDIQQLVHDAQEVQGGLDILEQDHNDWARERNQYARLHLYSERFTVHQFSSS